MRELLEKSLDIALEGSSKDQSVKISHPWSLFKKSLEQLGVDCLAQGPPGDEQEEAHCPPGDEREEVTSDANSIPENEGVTSLVGAPHEHGTGTISWPNFLIQVQKFLREAPMGTRLKKKIDMVSEEIVTNLYQGVRFYSIF